MTCAPCRRAFSDTRSRRYAHVTDALLDMHMGYRQGFLLELKQGKFSLDHVYFADETELVYGLAPRFGYSAKPLFAAEAHKSQIGRAHV